jgi:hypothetical protein
MWRFCRLADVAEKGTIRSLSLRLTYGRNYEGSKYSVAESEVIMNTTLFVETAPKVWVKNNSDVMFYVY